MTLAAAHNSGRSQINFNFPSGGGEWWALDLFKMFGVPNFSGGLVPTDFDANGYPLANPVGKSVHWVGSFPSRAGTLVMTWLGNGVLTVSASGLTATSGSLTSSGGAGRYEFTLAAATGAQVGITSWTSKITNIQIFYKDQESLLGTTYFQPDFKAKLAAAKIGVYRFLNWQDGNNSDVTQWAHRKSLTFATWGSSDVRPELYCGATSGTNDYTVNGNVGNGAAVAGIIPTTGDPTDKMAICVKIGNAQTFGKNTGITFDTVNNYVVWPKTTGVSITAASPGVVSDTAHGLSANQPVFFTAGAGTLPTGIVDGTTYYVLNPTTNAYNLSATPGGSAINTTGSPSGTYTRTSPHALNVGDPVMFGLNGASSLPTNINQSEYFRVKTVIDANNIEIARTTVGTKITLSGAVGSGFFATRQPTLALNSGGTPFPIKSSDCQSLGASGVLTVNFYMLWYDDTQKAWILGAAHANGGAGNVGFINDVPYEVMISLCQEMGAHPYFCTPPATCYPATDFLSGLANLVKTAQAQTSWMIPFHEVPPNELFNSAALPLYLAIAQCYSIAAATGNSSWSASGGNYHAWVGMVNSIGGQILNGVYGGTVGGAGAKYRAISGVWTIQFNSTTTSHNERMTGALYISTFGKSASDAPHNWISHNCCSQYFRPSSTYCGGASSPTSYETTQAAAYAATGDTSGVAAYVDDINSGANSFSTLVYLNTCYTNCASWGAGYSTRDGNAVGMTGYEGGYSPDYDGNQGNSDLDKFRAVTKLHPKLYDYNVKTYKDFIAAGGDFPSCFQMAGPINLGYSQYAWSVLEDLYVAADPPQWQAIHHFNNGINRVRW